MKLVAAGAAWLLLVADAPPADREREGVLQAIECITQAEHVEIKDIKGGDRSRAAIILRVVTFCDEFVAKDNPTINRPALRRLMTNFADDHYDAIAGSP